MAAEDGAVEGMVIVAGQDDALLALFRSDSESFVRGGHESIVSTECLLAASKRTVRDQLHSMGAEQERAQRDATEERNPYLRTARLAREAREEAARRPFPYIGPKGLAGTRRRRYGHPANGNWHTSQDREESASTWPSDAREQGAEGEIFGDAPPTRPVDGGH